MSLIRSGLLRELQRPELEVRTDVKGREYLFARLLWTPDQIQDWGAEESKLPISLTVLRNKNGYSYMIWYTKLKRVPTMTIDEWYDSSSYHGGVDPTFTVEEVVGANDKKVRYNYQWVQIFRDYLPGGWMMVQKRKADEGDLNTVLRLVFGMEVGDAIGAMNDLWYLAAK